MTSEFTIEGTQGDTRSVTLTDVHKHSLNDYVEVHISNLEDTNPITVTQLSVLVTQLG
jgi:hypothetical protein